MSVGLTRVAEKGRARSSRRAQPPEASVQTSNTDICSLVSFTNSDDTLQCNEEQGRARGLLACGGEPQSGSQLFPCLPEQESCQCNAGLAAVP